MSTMRRRQQKVLTAEPDYRQECVTVTHLSRVHGWWPDTGPFLTARVCGYPVRTEAEADSQWRMLNVECRLPELGSAAAGGLVNVPERRNERMREREELSPEAAGGLGERLEWSREKRRDAT